MEDPYSDPPTGNNIDGVCTKIMGSSDLWIEKIDGSRGPHDPERASDLCDPVAPGGMLIYELLVKNHGPSDAGQVKVIDLLPEQYVSHFPEQIDVQIFDDRGELLDKENGYVRLLAGRDEAREGFYAGEQQLGRMNADSDPVRIRLMLMVAQSAECGSTILNTAEVKTVGGDDLIGDVRDVWIAPWQAGTPDDNPDNNVDYERTRIECPSLAVRKTVSYTGECPGTENPSSPPAGAMVTFCIEVENTGTGYLGPVTLTDTLRTSMGTRVFTATLQSGDPKLPFVPGETLTHRIMVPPMDAMCGTATNRVDVSAAAVSHSGVASQCMPAVTAWDEIRMNIRCSAADTRLQLPALNTDTCETHLQVQNVGKHPAIGMMVVWGEPGACPPQAAGPLKIECTGLLKPGSAWTWTNAVLPAGMRSGIVYSLNAEDRITDQFGNDRLFGELACQGLFDLIVGDHAGWLAFDEAYRLGGVFHGPRDFVGEQLVLDFGRYQGEPLVVSVNRKCPDPSDPRVLLNAAYTGIGSYLEGAMDPLYGNFASYAPLVFATKSGLNSVIHIHNSGVLCSSLEIWLKGQDNCLRPILADVLTLTPGESVIFDPNTVVGPDWMGSAWIRASQPLGVVVDTMGSNHFTSYVGFPDDYYDPNKDSFYSIGSQVNYLPLIYSEQQGWDSLIQVQNLSGTYQAKVKVYFLDRSGGVITTIVDWICPRGSQTFALPLINSLPGNWVGHARVESQEWWTPGNKPTDPPRIQSVALLEKYSDPARTQRREAVAYNGLTEQVAFDWQVGKLAGGTQSGSAVLAVPLLSKGNRGITSEVAITNLVTKPGFTDFAIYIYDQNGLIDALCQKLHQQQVEYIDLGTWGYVPQNFLGSAVISATFWEHEVFDGRGDFVRNLVGLGGVVVERIGGTSSDPDLPGDESKAFEAVPLFDFFWPQRVYNCTGQPGWAP